MHRIRHLSSSVLPLVLFAAVISTRAQAQTASPQPSPTLNKVLDVLEGNSYAEFQALPFSSVPSEADFNNISEVSRDSIVFFAIKEYRNPEFDTKLVAVFQKIRRPNLTPHLVLESSPWQLISLDTTPISHTPSFVKSTSLTEQTLAPTAHLLDFNELAFMFASRDPQLMSSIRNNPVLTRYASIPGITPIGETSVIASGVQIRLTDGTRKRVDIQLNGFTYSTGRLEWALVKLTTSPLSPFFPPDPNPAVVETIIPDTTVNERVPISSHPIDCPSINETDDYMRIVCDIEAAIHPSVPQTPESKRQLAMQLLEDMELFLMDADSGLESNLRKLTDGSLDRSTRETAARNIASRMFTQDAQVSVSHPTYRNRIQKRDILNYLFRLIRLSTRYDSHLSIKFDPVVGFHSITPLTMNGRFAVQVDIWQEFKGETKDGIVLSDMTLKRISFQATLINEIWHLKITNIGVETTLSVHEYKNSIQSASE